jgi:hypothetical protein
MRDTPQSNYRCQWLAGVHAREDTLRTSQASDEDIAVVSGRPRSPEWDCENRGCGQQQQSGGQGNSHLATPSRRESADGPCGDRPASVEPVRGVC